MNYDEIIKKGRTRIKTYSGFKRDGRDIEQLREINKIISILGGRRVGKTYTLLQLMQEAIEKKLCDLSQIIFIDFAELDHQTINLEALHQFVRDNNIEHPIYIFDEIQELANFDRQLIYLYNLGVKIFITGSNSKLLSQELATILRGRTFEIHQNILSFQEFLIFKNHNVSILNELQGGELYDEYLQRGGYPEVVLSHNNSVKEGILRSYLDLLIYKDLIERYKIRNDSILQQFLKSLINGHTKELNIHKLFLTYKSQGFEVGKNTLYEYLEYITHIFFVSGLGQFYKKTNFEKQYIIDNGYMNIYSQNDNRGQKLENNIVSVLQSQKQHTGFVQDGRYEIDLTDGVCNRQICRELNDENFARETAFAKSSTLRNFVVTRHPHRFSHPSITFLLWSDVVINKNQLIMG